MSAKQIKAIRLALQMTQAEFARELGANYESTVSRIESGERQPTGAQLVLLRILADRAAKARRSCVHA